MIATILTALLFAFCVAVAGYVYYCFVNAPEGTFWQKLFYSTRRSATLFVQLASGFLVALANAIMGFADFLNAPEVRDWIKANFAVEIASTVIVFMILLTVWARFRTIDKD